MVAVAYRRWSFARGSNYKALTGKILVFWMSGRLWEVVAHGVSTVVRYVVEKHYAGAGPHQYGVPQAHE